MKKSVIRILALVLLSVMALGSTPALAAHADMLVGAADAAGSLAEPLVDYGQDDSANSRAYTVIDLGTNYSASINWTIDGGQTIRSAYNYKTGSGKIILRVSSTPGGSVIFYLYDTTDTLIGSQTVYIATAGSTIVNFTNLFTNREYYIKAENVSQYKLTVTGTIASI